MMKICEFALVVLLIVRKWNSQGDTSVVRDV